MATVVLTGGLRRFAGDEEEIEVDAANVRALVRALDQRFPGIGKEIDDTNLSISIDGEIIQEPLLEPLSPGSEVHFLPPISGG
jgi:molybdopterin converting factor small subunit